MILLKLIIAHALTDFSLQNQLIRETKNRSYIPNYLDKGHIPIWPYAITAHAMVNAGGVLLVTGSIFCTLLEFVLHFVIDFAKCDKFINLHSDQALHLISKIIYCFIVL